MTDSQIEHIIEIAKNASVQILKVYNNQSLFDNIEIKNDNSPLTLADKASHNVINEGLLKLFPQIPIISEEGEIYEFEKRNNWKQFWLIDPLDGTKEFIKRNGEFTVNIALIENGIPTFGLILVPVSGEIYYTKNKKSFLRIESIEKQIFVSDRKAHLIAVGSRSHQSENEANVLAKYDIASTTSIGSSLKFCLVAEGKADIYYRDGPTMEWDTAAGHALVNYAGGKVEGITYNKTVLRNGSFLCKNL